MDVSKLKNIRDNATAVQDYLADLHNWEAEIKKEDEKLIALNAKNKATTHFQETMKRPATTINSFHSNKKTSKKPNSVQKEECDSSILQHSAQSDAKPSGVADDIITKAVKLKDEGNVLYTSGQYRAAVAKYSSGLHFSSNNHILYANRAMAYIKLGESHLAEEDCSKCILICPEYLKAYLRRGAARLLLEKTEDALKDYEKVLQLEPWNKDAQQQVFQIQKKLALNKTEEEVSTTAPSKDALAEKQGKTVKNKSIREHVEKKLNVVNEHNKSSSKSNITDVKEHSNQRTISHKSSVTDVGIESNTHLQADLGKQLHEDSDIIEPIDKPLHLRAQQPLRKIDVVDVATDADIPSCIVTEVPSSAESLPPQPCSVNELPTDASSSSQAATPASSTRTVPLEDLTGQSVSINASEVTKAESAISSAERAASLSSASVAAAAVLRMPPTPRTSHQLAAGWAKLAGRPDDAMRWLQGIKLSTIRGLEVEVECLTSIISTMAAWVAVVPGSVVEGEGGLEDEVLPAQRIQVVHSYLEAVVHSRSFELNVLFLTDEDRTRLYSVLTAVREAVGSLSPRLQELLQDSGP